MEEVKKFLLRACYKTPSLAKMALLSQFARAALPLEPCRRGYTGSTSKAPKFLFLMARVLKHLKGATIPFLNRAPFKCFENRAVKNEKLGVFEVEAVYLLFILFYGV